MFGFQRIQYNKALVECPGVTSSGATALWRAGEGLTELLHGADEAHRLPCRAHSCPEIHQCLIKIIHLASRDERLRQLPEVPLETVAFDISLADENPV